MKRDWETLRWLLIQAESCEAGHILLCLRPGINFSTTDTDYRLQFEDEKFEDVIEHILLLRDVGFAEVKELSRTFEGITGAAILRLKSAGHDFLEAARNDTVWNQTKQAATKLGGATVETFFQLLLGYAKAELQKVTGINLG
jgi:Hypothetical protein (DUF2513)